MPQWKLLIALALLQLISCGDNYAPTSTTLSRTDKTNQLPHSHVNSSPIFTDQLLADSPAIIRSKNTQGSAIYYVFGSNGFWAKSSDLYNWIDLTNREDLNHNGTPNEINDWVLGFKLFQATNEETPTNPYDHSGFYYQLSKIAGQGIIWANDANNDGLVDSTPIQIGSAIKEVETIGFWSPSVVQLEDGNYYFYYSHCNLPGTNYCSKSHSYMGVAKSKNVDGPYENIAVFMQSNGQVGDSQSDQISGYDGTLWSPQAHPSALFPNAFFDKTSQPWLVYGSNAGGIWIKQLNAKTGLPLDFGYQKRSYGTRIAGGNLSIVERPSIWYSTETDYYYLLLTYTGSDTHDHASHNIRIARSKKPEGPYLDAAGNNLSQMAVDTKMNATNFSLDETITANYGVKLLGSHVWKSELGSNFKQSGYWSPGNASIFADDSTGKTFLLFDAATSSDSELRQIHIHELFFTENAWPAIAPLPYKPTNNEQSITPKSAIGDYQLVIHSKDNNVKPHKSAFIHLGNNGLVSGDFTGSFSLEKNNLVIELSGLGKFNVVIMLQSEERSSQLQLTTTLSGIEVGGLTAIWAKKIPSQNDHDKFNSIEAALKELLPDEITKPPKLPSVAAYGATITWQSNNAQLFNLTSNIISRPTVGSKNAEVILQAKITLPNGAEKIIELPIIIPAQHTNNLIAHYEFEESLKDSTGNHSSGVLTGKHLDIPNLDGAKFATGKLGNALLLDGTYGVNLGVGLLPFEAFTLSFWMNPTIINPNQPSLFIIPKTNKGVYDHGTFFGIYNQINDWAQSITVWNRNGSDENWPFLASDHVAQSKMWQHVAVSCRQGDCTIYVNGKTLSSTRLGVITGKNVNLFVGVNLWDGGFIGQIDELKIYDEALTAAEIYSLDYAGTPKGEWLDIAVEDLKLQLDTQEVNLLKEDLLLPSHGAFQSTISWQSSNRKLITDAGKVTRPKRGAPSQKAKLTATIAQGGKQKKIEIPVTVMPEYIPDPIVHYSFENNLYDTQWSHSSDKLIGRHLMAAAHVPPPQYDIGIKGKSLYLDGTYGAILAEHLIMDNSYTISVWLKPNALSLHTSALFWYVNWNQWLSIVPYDVNESLNIWALKQGVYVDNAYDVTLQTNEWVHITLSVNGKKGMLYLNGKLVKISTNVPDIFSDAPTNLAVGVNFWDVPFKGLIDELTIYPEPIGSLEAKLLYEQFFPEEINFVPAISKHN